MEWNCFVGALDWNLSGFVRIDNGEWKMENDGANPADLFDSMGLYRVGNDLSVTLRVPAPLKGEPRGTAEDTLGSPFRGAGSRQAD